MFVNSFWPIWITTAIVFALGATEIVKLADAKAAYGLVGWVPLLLAVPIATAHGPDSPLIIFGASSFELAFWILITTALGVLGCAYITSGGRGRFAAEVTSLWLAAPLVSLIVLKTHDQAVGTFFWKSNILFALIPLWIGDTLAYFCGKQFGKHLLAPKISPKKTIEGGIANVIGCLLGGLGTALLLGEPVFVGTLIGLVAGFFGQAGDLLESAMKRARGMKDSGTLLPGHGGILDRIDSILITAPMVALVIAAFDPISR